MIFIYRFVLNEIDNNIVINHNDGNKLNNKKAIFLD